jgi:drug/metabolite transporter (DMT)-like permease
VIARRARPFTAVDAWLLFMTLIWGGNYIVIKAALQELTPLAFNGVRLTIATALFLAAIAWRREPRPTRNDAWRLLALGAIGHTVYQLCFLGALSRTTVANTSLVLGCSPVAIALLSSAVGHDRVPATHWMGAALSLFGMYLVVGRGAAFGAAAMTGDILAVASVCCWAVYTVGARPLLVRRSPIAVTGWSMAAGTAMFLPIAAGDLSRVSWSALSAGAWAAILYSALLGLGLGYLLWYMGVQRLGNARTSVYSNLVPVSALVMASVWLGESLTFAKGAGAAAILVGVLLARVRPAAPATPPIEA